MNEKIVGCLLVTVILLTVCVAQAQEEVPRIGLLFAAERSAVLVESAFSALKKVRAGAFIVLRNPVTSTHRKRIVDLAVKSRLPVIYSRIEFTEAGGLMSYGAYAPDLYRRAATFVDKVLKGASPPSFPSSNRRSLNS